MLDSPDIYKELARKMKIVERTKGKYPNVSCKDAPVPPMYPVPNCPCGKACQISQSMHAATAGRAFYMCSDRRVSILISLFSNYEFDMYLYLMSYLLTKLTAILYMLLFPMD